MKTVRNLLSGRCAVQGRSVHGRGEWQRTGSRHKRGVRLDAVPEREDVPGGILEADGAGLDEFRVAVHKAAGGRMARRCPARRTTHSPANANIRAFQREMQALSRLLIFPTLPDTTRRKRLTKKVLGLI